MNALDEYQSFLARRIADGVRRAINQLEPARIGWGAGSVPQHLFNRRWRMKPGTPMPNPFGGQDQVVMNPGVGNPNLLEPAGPTDPQVSFISVQSTNGRPMALLANYSLLPSFTIELANGGYGYRPTPEQHELGGHETWLGTNRVEQEASRKIVAKLLELLARLKSGG